MCIRHWAVNVESRNGESGMEHNSTCSLFSVVVTLSDEGLDQLCAVRLIVFAVLFCKFTVYFYSPPGLPLCRCYFLFNGRFETSYFKCLDKFLPNFQHKYAYEWTWSICPSFCDDSRDIAMVIDFLAPVVENWNSHLHSVCWHSTTDERIATRMYALAPLMTPLRLINIWRTYGPVTPECYILSVHFCRAGYMLGFPCISSFDCYCWHCCQFSIHSAFFPSYFTLGFYFPTRKLSG